MPRVLIESPYAGDIDANVEYARACMRDCLRRYEAPFASHLLYTQPGALNDLLAHERVLGIEAGLVWGECADRTVAYIDRGISAGMRQGLARADQERRPIEYRRLRNW